MLKTHLVSIYVYIKVTLMYLDVVYFVLITDLNIKHKVSKLLECLKGLKKNSVK